MSECRGSAAVAGDLVASPWDALALPPGWRCNKNHDATLEAKFNKNLNASAPVIGPGTNYHHTKC